MPRRLLIIDGDESGPISLAICDGALVVGNSPGDVVIDGMRVIRVHCEVEVEGTPVVSDPGPSDAPLRQELNPGDALHLGSAHVRLAELAPTEPNGGDAPELLEEPLPDEP